MRVLRLIKKCTFAAHENIIFRPSFTPGFLPVSRPPLNEKNPVMSNLGWQPMTNIRHHTGQK